MRKRLAVVIGGAVLVGAGVVWLVPEAEKPVTVGIALGTLVLGVIVLLFRNTTEDRQGSSREKDRP
jgi:hypothetical protein